MPLITEIAAWSMAGFGLVLFAAQMLVREFGLWLGRRHADTRGRDVEGVGVVVGALLGLLAFVLALTLSFANTRFNERRAGTLAESNAIGTAWLRAEAIGHPRADAIARLLEEYTRTRLEFVQAGLDHDHLDAATQRTSALQSAIWGHLAALVREQPNQLTVSLMTALNETFDSSTEERFAQSFTLPPQLFWLLVGMALLGMMGLGFQLGLRNNPLRMLAAILTAVWTVVIVGILDLASARIGGFRTSALAYEWTIAGFRGGITIPPLPERR